MTYKYIDPTEEHQERFKDHVMSKLPGDWYRFAKPGTGIDSLNFQFFRGYWIVVGDLGDAVYQWKQEVTAEWIAGCNLDYVLGKCQASEVGYRFKEWDPQLCLEDMEKWAKEDCDDKDKAEYHVRDAKFAIEDGEVAWQAYVYDNGCEVFGDEFYEFAPNFGVRPHIRGILHLAALKVMVRKMNEKA